MSVRVYACTHGRCGPSVLYADIRYEELSLVIVAYNQVKGVYSSREFGPGCWPPSSKISDSHGA